MIDGVFVINAIAHAYNMDPANARQNRVAQAFPGFLAAIHATWNPPEIQVPKELFLTDQSVEVLTATQFKESNTDMAVSHRLALDGWSFTPVVDHHKNVEITRRWPDRYITYLGVNSFDPVPFSIKEMERQRADLPDAVGLKLYPDGVSPLRVWRMDDPKTAYPLYRAAQDLGLKVIAVHKAVPNGPVPMSAYKVDDVDRAAYDFPELNFEIVHAGMAFTAETAQAIARFPNVYANLEVTSLLLNKAPGLFEEALAELLLWGGPEKIFWADGGLFTHSRYLLERFWNLEFSPRVVERFGVQISREDKVKILGQSYADMIGLDIEVAKAKIADDEFARHVRENGLDEPFSNWRAMAEGTR
jgi:predicted TIM-barrel fold metal-dependent hydrolase